jgi:hypothetical protein
MRIEPQTSPRDYFKSACTELADRLERWERQLLADSSLE